jgi:hypothetical protein
MLFEDLFVDVATAQNDNDIASAIAPILVDSQWDFPLEHRCGGDGSRGFSS